MNDWLSVKNELPQLHDWYEYMLVYCQSKGTGEPCPIGIARYVGEWELLNDTGASSDLQYEMRVDEISHWMPMPNSPET